MEQKIILELLSRWGDITGIPLGVWVIPSMAIAGYIIGYCLRFWRIAKTFKNQKKALDIFDKSNCSELEIISKEVQIKLKR